jgi:hypothetical protein
LAFGLWAGVVAWGVRRITNQLETIGTDLKEESRRLNTYITQTEARLAVLESFFSLNGNRRKLNE